MLLKWIWIALQKDDKRGKETTSAKRGKDERTSSAKEKDNDKEKDKEKSKDREKRKEKEKEPAVAKEAAKPSNHKVSIFLWLILILLIH